MPNVAAVPNNDQASGEQVEQLRMLVKSEEYRAKATECAELAANTRDPASKRILEETARHWDELAAGLEKYEARLKPTITRGPASRVRSV